MEEAAPQPVKAGDGLSPKARRTRETLIGAARRIFARDGFLDARVSDISAEAGVAHGTFYTYFASKEAIFREVVLALNHEMREEPDISSDLSGDPATRIERANRHYIQVYRDNAAIMATLEQVVTFNAEIRDLRKEIRKPFLDRNVRAIRKWQRAGLADPELDPEYAATALQAMVDKFTYLWLVLEQDFDEEKVVQTLTRLWIKGLGIKSPVDVDGSKRLIRR